MANKQADSFHGELWFFTQRSGKNRSLSIPISNLFSST